MTTADINIERGEGGEITVRLRLDQHGSAFLRDMLRHAEDTPQDRVDPWTPLIEAYKSFARGGLYPHHPDYVMRAMGMVSNRVSRSALVDLVVWLLHRADVAETEVHDLIESDDSYHSRVVAALDRLVVALRTLPADQWTDEQRAAFEEAADLLQIQHDPEEATDA